MVFDEITLDFICEPKILYYQNRRKVFEANLLNLQLSEQGRQNLIQKLKSDYSKLL